MISRVEYYPLAKGKTMNDAVVLWGLLLLYGIPIATLAIWMEKMMHKGEDDE